MITFNVLMRIGGKRNTATALRLLRRVMKWRTRSGLLALVDHGEEITECAFMQADMFLFLSPFSNLLGGAR